MPPRRRPCPLRWRATDMRRLVLLALFALIALTAACAVGPGYRRSSLGMPDGWRPRAASEDSLRRFYDSLRTSRDTLLPAGADTARVPFVRHHVSASALGLDGRAPLDRPDPGLRAPAARGHE